jgi:hypothetical protein
MECGDHVEEVRRSWQMVVPVLGFGIRSAPNSTYSQVTQQLRPVLEFARCHFEERALVSRSYLCFSRKNYTYGQKLACRIKSWHKLKSSNLSISRRDIDFSKSNKDNG